MALLPVQGTDHNISIEQAILGELRGGLLGQVSEPNDRPCLFIKREGQFPDHGDHIYKKLGRQFLDELRGAATDLCVRMIDKGARRISRRATTSLMGKLLET